MKELRELTGSTGTMKNAVEAEFVDLPSLVNCQFVDVFVSIHTVKVQNAGKMKEEMDVRKKPVTVSSVGELENAGEGVGVIVVDSGCCNDSGLKVMDFSRFRNLREVRVGDKCFMYVEEVKLSGLSKLESVVIGKKCFTKCNSGCFPSANPNRHFYLKSCERVRELKIARYSFSDYSVCEIENVPSLEVIEMGELNERSYNFFYASLELKSDSGIMK